METRNFIEGIEEKNIKVKGRNLLNLLYNWLEEIVTITITDGFAIKKFSVNIKKNAEYEIVSKVSGEKLDLKKHGFKVEIKSPTFHLMEIKLLPPLLAVLYCVKMKKTKK